MSSGAIDLSNRTIVVTGASSGIGRASALLMGRMGARLFLVARDQRALDEVAAAIRADGGTAEAYAADVGIKAELLAAIDRAEARFGTIDGFFANAGAGGPKTPLVDYDDDAFDWMLTINLKSIFWAMKRLLPAMIERRAGAILVTGSLGSERGFPMTCGYNSAKHGLLGLVRSAAAEVARHNVRINAILPGLVETRMLDEIAGEIGGGDAAAGAKALGTMVPMGRLGHADELGQVAAFLLSDAASYVNGQAWAVDGGILHTLGATG
jgi:NAD(P)-dependent dehydrogenase (short-subunit alcohol dehydrogenase family)